MLLFVVILILPHKIMRTPYIKISYFGFNFDLKSTYKQRNVLLDSKFYRSSHKKSVLIKRMSTVFV